MISNYAFTEMRREIQNVYLDKILLSSTRGYITYNQINTEDFNSYIKKELRKVIPNIKVIEEVGISDPNDCIIVW